MSHDERAFWERLQDMPHWEAEQELVLRRERNNQAIADATAERAIAKAAGRMAEFERLGVEIARAGQQTSMLNDRLKYLRKLQDAVHWREAVRTVLGDEAVEQCIVYMEQRWGAVYDRRRMWARS